MSRQPFVNGAFRTYFCSEFKSKVWFKTSNVLLSLEVKNELTKTK